MDNEIDTLEAELREAREVLLSAIDGITPEAFVREASDGRSVRETLWHTGLMEDWARRTVSLASAGRPLPAFHTFQRPQVTSDVAHLLAWLEQCRRPTLALLRRLPEDVLHREFALPDGGTQSGAGLLMHIAQHDRAQAARIRALRGQPVGPGTDE